MKTGLLVLIAVLLLILIVLLLIKKDKYDGKFFVDTRNDIYRIVLDNLIDAEKKKKVILKIETKELSSLKDD